ncbi:hypothetical protein DIPPA_11069 [Diplonema papillatum]|nr:hypothetical protein DIPPA_11069 [Diplonema papillatum]
MSKAAPSPTTPSSKKRRTESAQLAAEESKQVGQCIADFVELYCVKKADKEVLHGPLKVLVGKILGISFGTRNGMISKSISTKFKGMATPKNLAEVGDRDLYAIRRNANTELAFCGIALRSLPTPGARATEAFKRLTQASQINLEECDMTQLYKACANDSMVTKSPSSRGRAAHTQRWPEITVLGERVFSEKEERPGRYWCIVIEDGCTIIPDGKEPKLCGNTLEFTFLREMVSRNFAVGEYCGTYEVPPAQAIQHGQEILVEASGGVTQVNIPLANPKVHAGARVVQRSWKTSIKGEAADPERIPVVEDGDSEADVQQSESDDDSVVFRGEI